MKGDLPELYRDEHLVAVSKPSGMLVHRGWGQDRIVAMTLVRNRVGKHVHPVHRLDRPTSGVLLFALDPETAGALGKAFAEGGIQKTYLALCRGVTAEHEVVDYPIPRAEGEERVPAVTEYWRRFATERYSLVEAHPRTGRLHQIRRHLKHLSHPLIGDVRYGDGKENRILRDKIGLHRLALHALSLELAHPVDGRILKIRATIPPDLREPLLALGVPAALLAELEAS